MKHQHYHDLLTREYTLVTDELQTLGILNPENPRDWVATPTDTEEGEADENVAADKSEELEERAAILADLEIRYNAIRRALAKIKDGGFGVCEVCAQQIEDERLEANPAARTCKAHLNDETMLPA